MRVPEEIRSEVVSRLPKVTGWNAYVLAMENDGVVEYHELSNRPCYGELRKYKNDYRGNKSEHVGQVTGGPENNVEKPRDLPRTFPDGTPVCLAFRLREFEFFSNGWDGPNAYVNKDYLDWLLGETSPYIRGFGSPESVEILMDEAHNRVDSVILHDMAVDPTVMIGLFLHLKHTTVQNCFPTYVENGLSRDQAGYLCLMSCLFNPVTKNQMSGDDYSFAQVVDVRRLITQNPHDFSGGTFKDRYDYHRPWIGHLFKAKDKDVPGFNFAKEFDQKFGGPQFDTMTRKLIQNEGLSYETFVPWFVERLEHYGRSPV